MQREPRRAGHRLGAVIAADSSTDERKHRPMTRAPITVSALVGVVLGVSCGGSATTPAPGPTPAAVATTPTAAVNAPAPAEAPPPATLQAPKAPIALEEYVNIRRVGSRSGI